ncbi:transposase [Collimonas pratensis]|uniref:transposase n=1 Tax=Collimonas pratensis TaxID=279113 RepID=UPI0007838056|nr:transposase [Collimonas pratensis]
MILTKKQWKKIEPLVVGRVTSSGARGRDNLGFIEGVLWQVSEMRGWSHLPSKFGSWNAIYVRFRRWNESGCWHQLVKDLGDDSELVAIFSKVAAYADLETTKKIRRIERAEFEKHLYFEKSFAKNDVHDITIFTDSQWREIETLFAGKKYYPVILGRRDLRFIEGVLWLISEEKQWREMPSKFGDWRAVYVRFKRWDKCGYWIRLADDLRENDVLFAAFSMIVGHIHQTKVNELKKIIRKNAREKHRLIEETAATVAADVLVPTSDLLQPVTVKASGAVT